MNSAHLPADKKVITAAEKLWQYMKLNHKLQPVELIFVLGSQDDRVAQYAAELYAQGLGKYILVSGGMAHQNDLLKTKWPEETEALHFEKILVASGVPASSIILEQQATNSGENIKFSYELLKNKKLYPDSILLIQKPYMERRIYATFMKQWPGNKKNIFVSSPLIPFKEYFNDDQPFDKIVNIMVGDLQRIIEYPKLGYQIYQQIPDSVQIAYDFLVKNKFDKHLIQH
jgi:uncharacterized SAM-binding protein YcdF (DUF218 family)